MLKVIIGLVLLAAVISLFSGLFFLVKDDGKSKRLANSLAVRVALATLFVILVAYAAYTGEIEFNASPISAF